MGDFDEWYVHTVDVETLTGGGPMGDTYGAPVTVPCLIDEQRNLVRSRSGDEVVSETTLLMDKSHYDKFTPESYVTYRGRRATVISRSLFDSGPLNLPDHCEIRLT